MKLSTQKNLHKLCMVSGQVRFLPGAQITNWYNNLEGFEMKQDNFSDKRFAYFIMEHITNDKGQFIPCYAFENESGYYKTDWHWGKDLEIAMQCAKEKNNRLELTEDDVNEIILSSNC